MPTDHHSQLSDDTPSKVWALPTVLFSCGNVRQCIKFSSKLKPCSFAGFKLPSPHLPSPKQTLLYAQDQEFRDGRPSVAPLINT